MDELPTEIHQATAVLSYIHNYDYWLLDVKLAVTVPCKSTMACIQKAVKSSFCTRRIPDVGVCCHSRAFDEMHTHSNEPGHTRFKSSSLTTIISSTIKHPWVLLMWVCKNPSTAIWSQSSGECLMKVLSKHLSLSLGSLNGARWTSAQCCPTCVCCSSSLSNHLGFCHINKDTSWELSQAFINLLHIKQAMSKLTRVDCSINSSLYQCPAWYIFLP